MLEFDKLKRRANSPEAPVWVATNFSVKTDYKRNDFGKSTEYQYHDPSIHIVGQFLYEDSDGLLRRTAFRRKLDPERERFYRLDGEPDLDYAD